jgi:hypothetical protein
MVMSATFPGVSAKATGLPRSSAKGWILPVLPPAQGPSTRKSFAFLERPTKESQNASPRSSDATENASRRRPPGGLPPVPRHNAPTSFRRAGAEASHGGAAAGRGVSSQRIPQNILWATSSDNSQTSTLHRHSRRLTSPPRFRRGGNVRAIGSLHSR